MSVYFKKQLVGNATPLTVMPIGLDEIGMHNYGSGAVTYNGERIIAGSFARTEITSFYGPNVKRFNIAANPATDGSGIYTFLGCTNLTTVNFPELLNFGTTGSSQFSGCTSLTLSATSFPKLASFPNGGYTFDGCSSITAVNDTVFPNITSFNAGGYQFRNCTSLTTVNLSKLTTFGGGGHQFDGCTALTTVNLPKLTSIGNGGYQFQKCSSLTNVSLPLLTGDPGNYTFSECTSLQHIFLPKFIFNGNRTYTFYKCSNLLTVVLPYLNVNAGATGGNDFRDCSKLTSVDLGKITGIKASDFQGCAALTTLVLRHTTMATLANINAFTGTPFASNGAGGTLYVPSALIASYQAATNWSTILGYAHNSIVAIEGSQYETKYVDGTSIS